ncbi:hypothetical protein O3M35_010253 [Rhynocoris fuscipes]|uniref:Secreted protein n=1 Tax=Rhynocoris fuscipes TaxID=488301 RepID=A0AAW1CZP3_9HEMI
MKFYSFVIFVSLLVTVYSVCWTTYLKTNHLGRSNHGCTSPGKCTTFIPTWKTVFKSINTHGGCVRLWETRGCHGKHLDLRPGSRSHNNLPSLGWIKTESIGSC